MCVSVGQTGGNGSLTNLPFLIIIWNRHPHTRPDQYSDLITALFLSQYPSGAWPSFFGDLIGTLSVSVAHVDMFVRVCDAIQTGILARFVCVYKGE